MSKKPEQVARLLARIQPRHPLPRPLKEASLLEQGLLAVLVRRMSQEKAEACIVALRRAYADWNEMRVAQAQEISAGMLGKGRKVSRETAQTVLAAARDARDFLQEVFQRVHGLDLEILRADPAAGGKMIQQMPCLGMAAGSWLLWQATGEKLPVHGGLVRVLDRLGLASRTGSMKKAGDLIGPLIEPGRELDFVVRFSEVADRWCDPRRPMCQACVLVEDCPYGKRVAQEWRASQARLEAQRVRELARHAALEKKEAARRARDEARAKKKAEAEGRRQERERARLERAGARRKAEEDRVKRRIVAEQKRLAAERAKAERIAKAKAAAEKKARAKKSAKGRR